MRNALSDSTTRAELRHRDALASARPPGRTASQRVASSADYGHGRQCCGSHRLDSNSHVVQAGRREIEQLSCLLALHSTFVRSDITLTSALLVGCPAAAVADRNYYGPRPRALARSACPHIWDVPRSAMLRVAWVAIPCHQIQNM
jgi:hypothetical protein